MTMQQPWQVLTDAKMQADADDRAFELAYANFQEVRQTFDDRVSGFHTTWKPRDRLALYEKPAHPKFDGTMCPGHLPVLLVPELTLDEFIPALAKKNDPAAVASLLTPHVPVLVAMALTRQPQPTFDAMADMAAQQAWIAEVQRLESGGATLRDVLSPYWLAMYDWDCHELEKLLRDYVQIARARERNGGSLEDDMLITEENL